MAADAAAILSAGAEGDCVRSCRRVMGRAVKRKWVSSLGIAGPGPLRVVAVTPGQAAGMPKEGETMCNELLWQEFFSDPSEWWDNRFDKRSPRSPDFRHKRTKEVLWIDSWSNPPWVKAKLGAMVQGQAECGDVRPLCMAGRLKEALHIVNRRGISADLDTYVCLLQGCIKMQRLAEGKQVHTHIIQTGFKPNIFLLDTLMNMYAKCGSVVDARQVFDKMSERGMFTWNIMIAGYAKHGCGREALEIYEQMIQEGVMPNKVTFICILKACANLAALQKGVQVHADIIKAGIETDVILETALADMYAKCRSMKVARQVFDNMAQRNVVSWNTMIGGYAQNGFGREAFDTYERMIREGVMPSKVTFVCILSACASLADLAKGTEVHAHVIKVGIIPDIILENALLDMYAKCGSINKAHQVFDNMAQRDVVSWNSIIAGNARHGCAREAFSMYEQMIREGVTPDKVTFICVLNACASLTALEKGKEIHVEIMKAGIVRDLFLENSLVDMYAKCGSMRDARQVFDKMVERDVVSWNAIIAGNAQHGCGKEALNMYEQMIREGVTPDQVTFICVLNACASLAALEKGKDIHADIIKAGIAQSTNLENTLVNLYAKCGDLKDAHQVFASMAERDAVSWNVMIAGYGQHGCGRDALQLFEQMQEEGLQPNVVTFTCVLCACSHVGLVEEARHYFLSMSQDHGFTPTAEHFGCMVDLLGRAGRLDEAESFVNEMPIEPGVSVWGALLGACRIHGNLEIAERAAKCLL